MIERLGRAARTMQGTLRTVMGVPDYDRYLAHVRRHHPGREPMTRDAFLRERLEARYSRPGARCC